MARVYTKIKQACNKLTNIVSRNIKKIKAQSPTPPPLVLNDKFECKNPAPPPCVPNNPLAGKNTSPGNSQVNSHSLGFIATQAAPTTDILLKVIKMGKRAYVFRSRIGYSGAFGKCYIARVLQEENNQEIPKYVIIKKMNSPDYGQVRTKLDENNQKVPKTPKRNETNEFTLNKEINYLQKAGWEIFDTLHYKGNYYMVMELMDTDLHRYAAKNSLHQPISVCYHIMSECINQLVELHQHNIAHRDIKPENMFMSNTGKVKIGDLGLAEKLGSTGILKGWGGTPIYMPPECISVGLGIRKEQNLKIDIWSLGLSLADIFMHRAPIFSTNKAGRIQNNAQINKKQQAFKRWYEGTAEDLFKNNWANNVKWDMLSLDINSEFSQYFSEMRNKEIQQWKNIGVKNPEPVIIRTILWMLNPDANKRPTASEIQKSLQQVNFNTADIKQHAINYISNESGIDTDRKKAMDILEYPAQSMETYKIFKDQEEKKVQLPVKPAKQ